MSNSGKGLIDPRYCCCAVPLVNFGIYAIIFEQGLVSLGVGVAAITAPSVVGASFPSFANYILAATCFIVAGLQPVGFIGVLREKTKTFKIYALANSIAVTAAMSVAAALIILSATRHSQAVSSCTTDYYSPSANSTAGAFASTANTTLSIQAEKICPPLIWAQVGFMGGLWGIAFVCQAYFLYLTRTYSASQVKDHKLYHSVYSENPEAFTMSILRSTRYNPNSVYSMPPNGPRDDTWDARPSMESLKDGNYDPRESQVPEQYYPPPGQEYQHANQEYYEADQQRRYEDAYTEGSRAYPNNHDGYPQSGWDQHYAEHGQTYAAHGSSGQGYGGQQYAHEQGQEYGADQGRFDDHYGDGHGYAQGGYSHDGYASGYLPQQPQEQMPFPGNQGHPAHRQ